MQEYDFEIRYDDSGRRAVVERMQEIHNNTVVVIKAKAYASQTARTLIGRVITPDSFTRLFLGVIYSQWGNEPNVLPCMAVLSHVESNQAATYLVFQPAD
ncbi:hypothetical protein ACFL5M_04135 [Candidatus Neomarinimicrobiota bacterium]